MLYLTRKIGESVVINGNIELTVVEVRGKAVKLGFTFPADATVLRREIFERVQAEKQSASAGGQLSPTPLREAASRSAALAGEGAPKKTE